MARAQPHDKPVKRGGTRSRASAKRQIAVRAAAEARAEHRFRAVQIANATGGTLEEQVAAARRAIAQDTLELKTISVTSLCRWRQKPDEAPSLQDFADAPRSGRPKLLLDSDVEEQLRKEVLLQSYVSDADLHRRIVRYAEERALVPPTYYKVQQYVQGVDLLEIAAARHGARAARIDATVHSTVPSDWAHHTWTLDALTAPVWVRMFHVPEQKWIAVQVDVIIIIDNKTRVVVAYHVVDPSRRNMTQGYDRDDVLATLFNAALPELADPATSRYAGCLPRILRWDRAPSHRAVMGDLRHHVSLEVPDLEAYNPTQRGIVEAAVNTLKEGCSALKGATGKWLVTGDAVENPKATRTKAAGTMTRVPTRMPVAVMDLFTISEFTEGFDRIVGRYNTEHQHSGLGGLTPDVAYSRDFDPRKARVGRDVLRALPMACCSVTKTGLVHQGVNFSTANAGRSLAVGTRVNFRPDPLLRAIFAEAWGEQAAFLMTRDQEARLKKPGDITIAQKQAAREASDNAAEVREQHRLEVLGPEGVARADAELAEKTAPKRRGRPPGKKHNKDAALPRPENMELEGICVPITSAPSLRVTAASVSADDEDFDVEAMFAASRSLLGGSRE